MVRRPNGLPLSFPVWMTEPAAGQTEMLQKPRLTLATLLDLRRLVTLYLSSLGSTDWREVTMWREELRQGRLFEENKSVRAPRPLHQEVAHQATDELVQWIRALAKAMGAGADNEQNKR